MDSKDLHPENIDSTTVNDEVLNLGKLIDFNELHPSNIEYTS